MTYSNFIMTTLLLLTTIWAQGTCLQTEPLLLQSKALMQRNQHLLALQGLQLSATYSCDKTQKEEARFLWGKSLFELDETEEALKVLNFNFEKMSQDTQLLKAWYIPEMRPTLASDLQTRFKNFDQASTELPQAKKPWLAGSLSALLPGAGQAYLGNYQSGLFAFALNALFFSATQELSKEGLHSTALASGAVFSIFYVGNITGSVQAARLLNEKQNATRLEELRRQNFPEIFSF